MKRFLSLLLILALAASFSLSAGAKVIFEFGDWTLRSALANNKEFSVDSYRGTNVEATIPDNYGGFKITEIGSYILLNNDSLISFTLNQNITRVGDNAFFSANALQRIELVPKVSYLGAYAFTNDAALTEVNLEDTSISAVNEYAFQRSGIVDLKLPETCTAIRDYAFANCVSLTRIYIPSTVTEIAGNAFNGCDDLVIYADEGSYAVEYAIAKGIDYVITNPDYYEVEILLGDADGDNDVSILDATRIQRWLASYNDGNEEQVLLCGDTDRDGDVSILDATLIQRWLAQFTVPTPIGEVITIQVPATE